MSWEEGVLNVNKVRGHVKWFDAARGYGFLVVNDGGGDVLLHANVLRNFGRSSITEDSFMEFDLQETDRGRQVATIHTIENAVIMESVDEHKDQEQNNPSSKESIPARVKWFDKAKGFGFANVFQSGEDIFLHIEVLKSSGLSDLQAGEAIAIRIIDGPRGKMAEAIFAWDDAIQS